jgi:hypothetical protein
LLNCITETIQATKGRKYFSPRVACWPALIQIFPARLHVLFDEAASYRMCGLSVVKQRVASYFCSILYVVHLSQPEVTPVKLVCLNLAFEMMMIIMIMMVVVVVVMMILMMMVVVMTQRMKT